MDIPGFSAERSLYVSKIHYSTTGAVSRLEADICPTFIETRVETRNADLCLGFLENGQGISYTRDAVHHRETFAAYAGSVVPMGVAAHDSSASISSECSTCTAGCSASYAVCALTAPAACVPLLYVPFVGEILYLGCVAAALAGCSALAGACGAGCMSVGGSCCPVSCGTSCCDFAETCAAAGLCCSSGTTPCGAMCCQGKEVCTNGVCCLPGSTGCGGTCCDNTCGQCVGGTCIPVRDGTACPIGTCCGGTCTSLVSDSNNCGACGNKCPPTAPFCIGGFCSAGE